MSEGEKRVKFKEIEKKLKKGLRVRLSDAERDVGGIGYRVILKPR